jgi:N-acetylneuraminic acid mutarotase
MIYRLFYFFCFLLSTKISFAQNWIQISDFPGTERDDGTGFQIGDSAYFGTGITPWWSNEKDFYGLNLSNDEWFPISSLPENEGRQYATGFSSNGKGYVFGGYNGMEFLNDLWCYDPNTDSWSEKSSLPAVGRSGCSKFIINDTVYIIGGKTSTQFAIGEIWCYVPTSDVWLQKPDFPFGPRWRASAAEFGNTGYLIFGRDYNNNFHNEFYSYSSIDNSWTQIDAFPTNGRSHAVMCTMNSEFYVGFGIDSLNNSFNDLWRYDLAQNTWIALPGIPALGRRGGMAITFNDVFYYSTGINEMNQRLKETWKYMPNLSINELNNPLEPSVIRITDIMGKDAQIQTNRILIYHYIDGTSKKVFILE